jgi:hypothetical protein
MTQPVPRCPSCEMQVLSFRVHLDTSIAVVCSRCQLEFEHWPSLHDVELSELARFFPSAPALPSAEELQHTRTCTYWESEEGCSCSLEYRVQLQTEQTMHAAWRKRAEEAEQALAAMHSLSPEQERCPECEHASHAGKECDVDPCICGRYAVNTKAQPPAELVVEWPEPMKVERGENYIARASYAKGSNDMLAACRAAVEKAVRKH